MLLHYLRLTVWPHPLLLDPQWPIAKTLGDVFPASLLLTALVLGTIGALRYRAALGFLGIWFFVILLPTSSVIPLRDPAFEHRMYLPLVAPIVLIIFGGWELLGRWVAGTRIRQRIAAGLVAIGVILLGALTIRRNVDYQDVVLIWRDIVNKRPDGPRGHHNLGGALFAQGKLDEAIASYRRALQLKPHSHQLNRR